MGNESIMKTNRTMIAKPAYGFTLVEMMVAMTVGIMVLIALSSVMINNSTSRRSGDRNATLQTSARYAIEVLRRDVQHAGYAGGTGYMPNTADNLSLFRSLSNPASITGACSPRAGHLEWPVEASDNTNNFTACVPNTDYVAGTDMLIVRHTAQQSILVPPSSATDERVANVLYYYSDHNAENSRYGIGPATPTILKVGQGLQPVKTGAVYAVQENIYYIRPWSFSATENPRIPALVMRRLVAGPTGPAMSGGDADLIAPGIVNMQLKFGLSSDRAGSNPSFNYQNWAPGLVDASNAINIPNSLESVRISLLMQSMTPEPKYLNTETYLIGDDVTLNPQNDSYRRSVVSSTVQVRR
jgi:type IV pilus assembly protein PilW